MGLFDELKDKASKKASDLHKMAGMTSEQIKRKASKLSQEAQSKTSALLAGTSKTIDEAIDGGKQWIGDLSNKKVPSKEELTEWAENSMEKVQSLAKDFDAEKMWDKIKESAAKAGQELVVMVLTMYYTIAENFKKGKSP